MKKISVVIPVYYNEESLPGLFSEISKIEQQLLTRDVELELIFVDDCSGDNSFAVLKMIKNQRQQTKLVRLARNSGSHSAIKAGFNFVTGDCFTILSADLQDPPELILKMVDQWLAGEKYIICTRAGRNDPLLSKLFAAIYYKLLRFFVVSNYPSGGYDIALMDGRMLSYLKNSAKNINVQLFAFWLGFNPVFLSYKRQPRLHGKSRWTFSKKLKFFLDSFLGFSIVPMRLISAIGLLVSCFGFMYGIVVVINALLGNIHISGFATLAALISFLLGLIIVMLGVLGEYLWRIFDETKHLPEVVIDEVH